MNDHLKQRILDRAHLRLPIPAVIRRLLEEADQARLQHARYPKTRQHKRVGREWEEQARIYLFRGKRARVLAALFAAKQDLYKSGLKTPTAKGLASALKTGTGKHAIEVILKHVKAVHVGIDQPRVSIKGIGRKANFVMASG